MQHLQQNWAAQAAVILLATAAIVFACGFLLRLAAQLVERAGGRWGKVLEHCALRPLQILVTLLGVIQALRVMPALATTPLGEPLVVARQLGIIACVTAALLCIVRHEGRALAQRRLESGDKPDITTIDAVSKLVRLVIVVIAGLMVMQEFGLSITSLLALGGIGGIAVGFAARDVLANFLGGLTIYLDRPFSVGDWIRSPDKPIEGMVEEINWRHTRIRAFNKNPIYVPNAIFTTAVVENPSRMTHRRLVDRIPVRYSDLAQVAGIIDDVRTMLRGHEGIDASQTLLVTFDKYGAVGLEIYIYCFTNTTAWARYLEIKQDVLLKIGAIVTRHGAAVALPTRTVHLPERPAWAEDDPTASAGREAEAIVPGGVGAEPS